ncbi:MAG: DegT/DnrJ/EryC1/StrS aminotransferase family protein [Gammaproteobacteria bacterium]|nr:DegT/DnrJ/EryC1/StrS aminotransferase family protein [Gammaproteobacteria bacterium]
MRIKFQTWPFYENDEIEAVRDVLYSGRVNYWTGDQCKAFEKEYASYCGAENAITLANGSVAIELALKALEIGRGDEVIVTSRTFIASVSEIVRCGAMPVFCDVDSISQNINENTIKQVLSEKTKAIIAVHLAGWPCDMDSILAIAKEYGLKVVEDCAQAHGATYKGKPVGSFGDAAIFSFCQDKIISTGGEGGMLVTNNKYTWEKAWAYKDHGKSYNVVFNKEHTPGFRWLHESFGTNYRMTEMQAAIGRIQLRKLDDWVEKRRENAATLSACFKNIQALRVTEPPPEIGHAYYKFYCFIQPEKLKKEWSRGRILQAINDIGVPCYSGSCSEVYLETAFVKIGLQPKERLLVAKQLGETSLMFLVHPTLSDEHMKASCDAVNAVMKMASA